ncbi:MAG: serine/threonine protein phosphatase [Prosthecobacter sp.]|jgi:serine/threonine protein phosphatase 1|uniref:metallophosphoesterase n=1 Tax=Prosthecobacter sp. TaxID=1965333 RepID=UPI001A0DB3AB|nr:metallophosphoesterase [Prosthecobacter sp.]MBE2285856.1 serine/threonine protein phosphatase [Prosthecobacter sp.]
MPILVSDDAPDTRTSRVCLTPRETKPARTLVIGDIHGCSTALELLLKELAPQPGDTLVTLGDYVDRGPDSRGVLHLLLEMETRTQLVPLLGNHEILMLDARDSLVDTESWYGVGGRQTMQSYGCMDKPDWNAVPEEHWAFLRKRLRRWHATDTHIFVHANANAMLPMEDQSDDWLFWRRFDDSHPHFTGKTLICGHTAQKDGLPRILPGRICIDTWVYGEGWLTGLDVNSSTFIQASQRGEVRRLSFDEVRMLTEKA